MKSKKEIIEESLRNSDEVYPEKHIGFEGWEPTPAEHALLEGTLDNMLTDSCAQEVPEDLLHFKEFGAAMEDIKRELDICQHSSQGEQNGE